MPYIRVNGTELWYEDTGGSLSPILFSHGLLFSVRLFTRKLRRSETVIVASPTITVVKGGAHPLGCRASTLRRSPPTQRC